MNEFLLIIILGWFYYILELILKYNIKKAEIMIELEKNRKEPKYQIYFTKIREYSYCLDDWGNDFEYILTTGDSTE